MLGLLLGLLLALFAAYQVRPEYKFELGGAGLDEALSGFYGPERNAEFGYRWSYPNWEIQLPLAGRQDYRLEIESLSLKEGEARISTAENKELARFIPTNQLKIYAFNIPASDAPGDKLRLKISSPITTVAGDKRDLGLLVTKVSLKAVGGGVVLPPLLAGLGLLGLILPLYLIPAGFLGLGGRIFGRWPLALLALLVGLWVCLQAALDRTAFARLLFPAGVYLAAATGLQYFFLLVPTALQKLLDSKFKANPAVKETPRHRKYKSNSPLLKWLYAEIEPEKSLSQTAIRLWGAGAGLIYLILRLFDLLKLPIFLDEALHIGAARGAQAGDLWVLALPGKALQGWLLAFTYNQANPDNWLLVGRWLSMLAGLVTLGALYLIGSRLYSARVGLLASWLWAVLPYAVWHERMALVDPLMTAFTTLVILFSLRLFDATNRRAVIGYGVLLGLALTCGELTKLSAAAAALFPLLVLVFLYSPRRWLLLSARLAITAPVFFLTTVPVIRLFNGVWGGEYQDERFAGFDPAVLAANIRLVLNWLYSYFTAPLLLLLIMLPFWALLKDGRRGGLLLLAGLLPMAVLIIMSRIIYSRYILFMLVPLVIFMAAVLIEIWQRRPQKWPVPLLPAIILLLALPLLWLNWQMITNPATAPLPQADRVQYVEAWPSGYGINEVASFLKQQANLNSRRVTALVRNAPVITNDGLIVTLAKENSVAVTQIFPPQAGLADRLQKAASRELAFIVVTRADDEQTGLDGVSRLDDTQLLEAAHSVAPNLRLELVFSTTKPGGNARIEVYRITPG